MLRDYLSFLSATLFHPGRPGIGSERRVYGFAILSLLLGFAFAEMITDRYGDAPQILPILLVMLPVWTVTGAILHGCCRLLGGRASWRASIAATFSVGSVLFLFAFVFACIFGFVVSERSGIVFGEIAFMLCADPTMIGMLILVVLTFFYFPLAMRGVHRLSWARTGIIIVLIPAAVFGTATYRKHTVHADKAIPAVDETGINFIQFSNFDAAQKIAQGNGVKIAICDSYFDMSPESAAKYVDPVSLIPGESVGSGGLGHGEWMATIVHQGAPEAKIIPIRAGSVSTRNFCKYLCEGIRYAADHGAAAVESSMGAIRYSRELLDAVEYAEKKGTVFINVHPVNRNWPFSADAVNQRIISAGPMSVAKHRVRPDPARDIYAWPYSITPTCNDDWGYSDGPPVVAAAVALMKSANPDLTPAEVKEILMKTARMQIGFRVLDAEAAVKEALRRKNKEAPAS